MDAPEWATVVSAVAAAGGAIAAWASARASRVAISRNNMPFVWPEYQVIYDETEDDGIETAAVRVVTLHNDGPGIAVDVRWSTWSPTEAPERSRWLPRRWRRDAQADTQSRDSASKSIRAMQPGDTKKDDTSGITLLEGDPFWVVVRYSDSAGERWEYTEPGAPRDLAGRPRCVPSYDRW